MGYDISRWKTRKLENLTILQAAFFRHKRTDWHPEFHVDDPQSNVAVLECGCEQEITGTLADGNFTVTEFDMTGEGSGTFWEWILEPALKESTGILEATLVWEGGDTIERVSVRDGIVTKKEIEL